MCKSCCAFKHLDNWILKSQDTDLDDQIPKMELNIPIPHARCGSSVVGTSNPYSKKNKSGQAVPMFPPRITLHQSMPRHRSQLPPSRFRCVLRRNSKEVW